MPNRLLKRLVETVIVIGADENSGLQPFQLNKSTHDIGLCPPESYAATVLATFTESKAIYPYQMPQVDPFYPPRSFSATSRRLAPQVSLDERMSQTQKVSKIHRRSSQWKGAWKETSQGNQLSSTEEDAIVPSMRKKSILLKKHAADKPVISSETIDGIPSICYPEGMNLSTKPMTEEILHFVLTDIKGDRMYASFLTFSRTFYIGGKASDGCIVLNAKHSDEPDDTPSENYHDSTVFVPCTVTLISKHPYFTVFREILSSFRHALIHSDNSFRVVAGQFAVCVTHTPIPPPGDVILECTMFGKAFRIPAPIRLMDKIVDFDITLLFQHLSVDDIVLLLSALLVQKRLVLASKSPIISLLCCETLMLLLSPFLWKFTYVPYLTANLLELLDAPGPYLYGCDTCHLEIVSEAEDVIIANLDDRNIISMPLVSPVPNPPRLAVARLKSSLSFITFNFERFMMSKLEPLTIESEREKRREFNLENQKIVLTGFMEFMVDIFRDVTLFIRNTESTEASAVNFFNVQNFVKAQLEAKVFYESVVKTELFDSFLRDRFRMVVDTWSRFEQKTRKQSTLSHTRKRTSTILPLGSNIFSTGKPGGSLSYLTELSISNESVAVIPDKFVVLPIPPYLVDNGTKFFDRFIQEINVTIKHHPKKSLKAAYIRIRSDLHFADGKKIEALRDMYELSKTDIKFIDKTEIYQMIDSLSGVELIQASGKLFFDNLKKMVRYEKGKKDSIDGWPNRILKRFHVPQKPIGLIEFFELVQNAEISSDSDIQHRLFKLFTLDDQQPETFREIDPERFKLFYQMWQQNANDLETNIDVTNLKDEEVILKVSSVTRLDPVGSGHMILTQLRILIVLFGSREAKHVVWLREISDIEQHESFLRVFGQGMRTLQIRHSVPKMAPLVAWLKHETKMWRVLLTETWSALIVSIERKDTSIINEAMDNFFILDTVYACATEDEYFKSNLQAMIKLMTSFTSLKKTDYKLPQSTRFSLEQKLNPNPEQPDKKSVEALLVVPGNPRLGLSDQLWGAHCGDRTGNLVLFDATNLTWGGVMLSLDTKMMCMILVPESTIWIGSLDQKIYIVDILEKTLIQELICHQDFVLTMALSQDRKIVASGSLMGEIVLWNAEDRCVIQNWRVPEQDIGVLQISFYDSKVLCCSRGAVLLFDVEGNLLVTFPQHTSALDHLVTFESHCIVNDFIYVGNGRVGTLYVYSLENLEQPTLVTTIHTDFPCRTVEQCPECTSEKERCLKCKNAGRCRGISQLRAVDNQVWACCKDGNIFVFNLTNCRIQYQFRGHTDAIQAICVFKKGNRVFTGARGNDGKIAVWRIPCDQLSVSADHYEHQKGKVLTPDNITEGCEFT